MRLLAIGLPLTIGTGFLVAAGLYRGSSLWVVAVIAAAVAPTDAALGAPIVQDSRVPGRIRRVLNVESGLNDGIATPFVGIFVAGAAAAESIAGAHGVGAAALDLLGGLGVGVGVGLGAGALLRLAVAAGYSETAFRPLVPLASALLAYAAAVQFGTNGFIAAFVGGMAFGSLLPAELGGTIEFTNVVGELLSLLMWFLVGAAMLVPALQDARWQDVAFAVLALTVVRMVPVAIASIGLGLDRRTVAFIGWFGPRGLASVIFALLAYDALDEADGARAGSRDDHRRGERGRARRLGVTAGRSLRRQDRGTPPRRPGARACPRPRQPVPARPRRGDVWRRWPTGRVAQPRRPRRSGGQEGPRRWPMRAWPSRSVTRFRASRAS